MTTNDSFERRLAAWLERSSAHVVPNHLEEVLLETIELPQRRYRARLERWLPMSSIARGRVAARRPALLAAATVALAAMAILGALMFAGGPNPQPERAPASNGRIFVADGTSVVSYAADGSDRRLVAVEPNGASDLVFSPDGAHLSYVAGATVLERVVIDAAGNRTVLDVPAGMSASASRASWSPDGDELVFGATDGARDHLVVAAADGSSIRKLGTASLNPSLEISWMAWSPDGTSIAFLSDSPAPAVFVVAPDGTGLRRLPLPEIDAGDGASLGWSPDTSAEQLLHVVAFNRIRIHDVANDADTVSVSGFWPTWSPDGDRISYWNDGTIVAATDGMITGHPVPIRLFASFTENCPDRPELAGAVFCGPASWSPDGSRLIAPDMSGRWILSLRSDGSGDPIRIELETGADGLSGAVAWQPVFR